MIKNLNPTNLKTDAHKKCNARIVKLEKKLDELKFMTNEHLKVCKMN